MDTLPLNVPFLVKGYNYMRNGIDYENSNGRYYKAIKAFKKGFYSSGNSNLLLARYCLYIGICYNENRDIKGPKRRNRYALRWYNKALQYIVDDEELYATQLRMSINNSIGVALHHYDGGGFSDIPIPSQAFVYYKIARDLFCKHPKNRFMKKVMSKIESNTGTRVTRNCV